MIKPPEKVSSDDKPGRSFGGRLQANLISGEGVVAGSGTQVYGQVLSSKDIGRGIVAQRADLVLTLTEINIEGTMYPMSTSSFSEQSTAVILKRRDVVLAAGSLLEFKLTRPLVVTRQAPRR